MIIPIGTDRPLRRTPWVNYALIAANIYTYFQSYSGRTGTIVPEYFDWQLIPTDLVLNQFITYQFLHGGLMHLITNLIFLLIFGNHINDKLGHIGYAMFYLAGGISSGIGHVLYNAVPCVGASGSICAVTGAYLVLFPRTIVTVLFWLYFFVDTFTVRSMWLIVLQVGENLVMSLFNLGGAVAYEAHLFGYLFGIVTCVLLLGLGILSRDHYDLLNLLRLGRKR